MSAIYENEFLLENMLICPIEFRNQFNFVIAKFKTSLLQETKIYGE